MPLSNTYSTGIYKMYPKKSHKRLNNLHKPIGYLYAYDLEYEYSLSTDVQAFRDISCSDAE